MNSIAIGSSTVASKGLLFLWQLILARALHAEGYGVYGTIGAMLAVGAGVTDLGVGLIVIREVARRTQDGGRYLGATLVLQPLLAVVAYAALMAGALALGYDPGLRRLLAFAAVSLLIDALGNMCHNQLLAAERMQAPAAISIGHVVLMISLGGAALASGGGLWGLYTAIVTAGLVRTAAYWIVLRRSGCRPVFPLDRALLRALLVGGFPLALAGFLSLASAHADKLISASLLGPESTGFLTAAFVIVFGAIELLNTPMLIVTFPLMARAFAGGHLKQLQDLVRRLSWISLVVTLPLAIYVSILAPPLARGLFGREFGRTADVLRVLIWYAVVTMLCNILAQMVTAQNRQTKLLAIRLVGLAMNVAFSLLLIPRLGISGIALAATLAEGLVLVQLLAAIRLPAAWWGEIVGRGWRLGLVLLALAALIFWLRNLSPLLAALAGVPAYVGLMAFGRVIPAREWGWLREALIAAPLGRIWTRAAP